MDPTQLRTPWRCCGDRPVVHIRLGGGVAAGAGLEGARVCTGQVTVVRLSLMLTSVEMSNPVLVTT